MHASLASKITAVRRAVPARAVEPLIWVRTQAAYRSSEMQRSRDEMKHMLRDSSRSQEIETIARRRVQMKKRRGELRYHPKLITRQRVENLNILTQRDQSRAYLLNFMHHGQYDGMFGSIERLGVHLTVAAAPGLFEPGEWAWHPQHLAVCGYRGSELIPTTGGVAALSERMRPGVVLAIASDWPGSTPFSFFGAQFAISSGAARIACDTDSPVVIVSSHLGTDGQPFVRLHPPLEPSDYPGPLQLLAAMLAVHEGPALAWPEALDDPFTMWKHVNG